MMRQIGAWWRARTRRERLLLQVLGALAFVVLAPLWAYQAATAYRADAAADLASALDVKRQVAALAAGGADMAPSSDGSLQGAASAAAQSLGLEIAHVEPLRQERLRIAFQPSNSVLVYRWLAMMTRHGVHVSRTSIVRVDESEDVRAEFELAPAP